MTGEAGRTRVARDEAGARTRFEEIEVGKDLGEIEWVVAPDDIDRQCAMDDDAHEWFLGDSPFGGRIAPPQIQYRPPRWLLSRTYNVRGVFYKWEFENVRPIRPGVRLRVRGRIAGKWVKNDREFVAYEAEARDESGEVVFRTTRVHALDVISRAAPRQGSGIDSGVKPERI
ncbi:MAG: MaoC family dehydratase [Proteobacteria bacterium]|nr:MaoC family dehydratase [Pseudomonadota bacterium]